MQKSARHLAPLVELIASSPTELWGLDLHGYDAYDTYLTKVYGFSTFSAESLRRIAEFYRATAEEIDALRSRSIDLMTVEATGPP